MKVVLTGTESFSQPLAEALAAEGFEVETCPLVAIEPLGGPLLRPAEYDWLLLTSRNGVDALFERLEGPLPRVAVVGPGTAAALRERGIEPHLVASISTQEGLAAELPRPSGRVLFAGAEDARDVLVRELGADFVPVYRTVEVRPGRFPDGDLAVAGFRLCGAEPGGARGRRPARLDRPGDLRRGARARLARGRRGLDSRPGRAPRSG